MKTFKLISLQILEGHGLDDIHLFDGLMINKEDEHNRWLMEAFIDQSHLQFFQHALSEDMEVTAHVVISKKENDPATFTMKVHSVKVLDGRVSVLAQGYLKRTSNYAELLLSHLIHQGLSGDELLQAFREKMIDKPKLQKTK